jgi:hypothetical protein
MTAFAEEWANTHLGQFTPKLEFEPTAGACLESGRKHGGLSRYLYEQMALAREEIDLKPFKKYVAYPMALGDESVAEHTALLHRLIKELPTEDPQASTTIVCERGFKVRVVTKSPGALVALAHQGRLWLASGLRRDKSIKMVLEGDHRKAVEEVIGIRNPKDPMSFPQQGHTVVSSDLKSATDLIGQETYQALWEGIRRSTPGQSMPKWLVRTFELALGPQMISYPELGRHVKSKRGALMGMPTTWPFLCLSNLCWWHLGHKNTRNHVPRPVAICGDDLVGCSGEREIKRYETAAKESGALFSSAVKHIKSARGGVFTEEIFLCRLDPIQGPLPSPLFVEGYDTMDRRHVINFYRWSEAFPTRGILGTMRTDRTGKETPYWTSLGPALEHMMAERKMPARKAMLAALRAAHPELPRFLREHGLKRLWHIPRQFGGLGIPVPESLWDFEVTSDSFPIRAAFSLSRGSGWEDDLSVLSRPYSQSLPSALPLREEAEKAVEWIQRNGFYKRYQVMRSGGTVPPGMVEFPGTFQDLTDTLIGNTARDLFFHLGWKDPLPARQAKLNGTVARELSRTLYAAQKKLVQTKGGWTCGKSISLNWKHALAELESIEFSRVPLLDLAAVKRITRITYKAGFRTFEPSLAEFGYDPTYWEDLLAKRKLYEQTSRLESRVPGTRIRLLPSQLAEERRKRDETAVSKENEIPILERPVRDWASRQTKRTVARTMGWLLADEQQAGPAKAPQS